MAALHNPENGERVRKVKKHQPNPWDCHFLQSLSSPYDDPSYREKVTSLIEKIKEKAFIPLLGNQPGICDMVERFVIVDAVQRLGIHRYFEQEIKSLLDYTYKHWNEHGISWGSQNSTADLNTTALGFRVLRFNRYHVSQEVFKTFCDENGEFVLRGGSGDVENEIRGVLSLYQAADLCFPGETLMREAKSFGSRYLQQTLEKSQNIRERNQLLMEVEYFMKNSWGARYPRWEAWNSIHIFRQDIDSWMSIQGVYRMSNAISKIILEAAILDFNIIQAQYQIELKIVSKWWNQTCVKDLDFFRHRYVEYYIAYVCGLYEIEFSQTRIAYTKFGVMCTVIDDMFDTHGTIDDLVHFKTALIKWDESKVANLPEDMQISYKFLSETYTELVGGAEKIHGPRARKWFEDYWTDLILAQWQDAQWRTDDGHLPTLNQYLENATISCLVPISALYPMLQIDTVFPDDILENIKKFEYDVSMAIRLIDDYQDFKVQKELGEEASWLDCYISDNPGTTREQALDYGKITMQLHMEEVNKDFLFYEKDIPTCCKRVYFDSMYRWTCFLWGDVDAFSYPSKQKKEDITKVLINPIPAYP